MTTSTLVQFGRSGFVGRFTSGAPLARGARVVVRGPRGVEPGVVLCEPGEKFAPSLSTEGELLRAATADDDALTDTFPAREAALLEAATAAASELPLAFVDAELTLDGHLILHGLAWGACDATPLFAELSARFGLAVRLLDLSQTAVTKDPEPVAAKCDKPGCGSEGGGCSSCGTDSRDGAKKGCASKSCSSGKVKSADEMTAYFADLRRKMEQSAETRTPLV